MNQERKVKAKELYDKYYGKKVSADAEQDH